MGTQVEPARRLYCLMKTGDREGGHRTVPLTRDRDGLLSARALLTK